jgi:hypothetical protein
MNCKGFERKRSCPNLRYYFGISMGGLRKTTKNVSQKSRSPGRHFESYPDMVRNYAVPRLQMHCQSFNERF